MSCCITMNFEEKVAIVTGGAQGIGKAICKALLDIGMKLLICDVDESSCKLFVEEMSDDFKHKVIFQICDVSSFQELRAAFEKAKSTFGRIDVVINNAGVMNEPQWKKMIEVNLIGVINGIHLAFEFMGTNNGGLGGFIINTASNAGLWGFPLAPIYSACKHGIVGLTRSYGAQYHFDKTGVTVNAVCPGRTATELFYTFPQVSIDEKEAVKHKDKSEPMSADEVGKAVVQLLKDGKNGALLQVTKDGMNYAV